MSVPLLFGPYGSTAVTCIEQLPAYGSNALWFHGFSSAAFEACAKHQIAPCVEFPTFRPDFTRRPELTPIGVDGRPIRYGRLVQGMCLSQPQFLQEVREGLLAGIRAYKPLGIWLDYLTYAGWFEVPEPDLQESCFCSDCIAEFCQATNLDLTTPQQILRNAASEWTRHKCERIAQLAAEYAALIRAHLPECIIGAYMCPWTPHEFDGALKRIFAQDYALLAPAIDVFTPLIYAKKSGRPPSWGRELLSLAPGFVPEDRKVQLILDVLDFPESLVATAEAVNPSWGVQLFGGAQVFADPEQSRTFARAAERIRRRVAQVER